MITYLDSQDWDTANATPDPKFILWTADNIIVYTGSDIPSLSQPPYQSWDDTQQAWVADATKLANAQNQVVDSIRNWRDNLSNTIGVNVGGYWWQTDTDDRIKYIALLMMGANIPANTLWKTMTGTFVTVTATLVQGVFQAVAASDATIYAYCQTQITNMLAASDPLNYDYTQGWPTGYTGG